MSTDVDDRLAAIEDGIGDVRALAESVVELAKASRRDNEAVQERLSSLDKTLTRLRTDAEIVRGDMNLLRANHQEVQDKVSSIHMNVMAVSVRTGTLETMLSGHTRDLREKDEQRRNILRTLRGDGDPS